MMFRKFFLVLQVPALLLSTSIALADFLYVANESANTVGVYSINASTGALTFLENESTGLAPTLLCQLYQRHER